MVTGHEHIICGSLNTSSHKFSHLYFQVCLNTLSSQWFACIPNLALVPDLGFVPGRVPKPSLVPVPVPEPGSLFLLTRDVPEPGSHVLEA